MDINLLMTRIRVQLSKDMGGAPHPIPCIKSSDRCRNLVADPTLNITPHTRCGWETVQKYGAEYPYNSASWAVTTPIVAGIDGSGCLRAYRTTLLQLGGGVCLQAVLKRPLTRNFYIIYHQLIARLPSKSGHFSSTDYIKTVFRSD